MTTQYSNEEVKKKVVGMGKLSSIVGYIFIIGCLLMFFLGDMKNHKDSIPSIAMLAIISIALILWGINYKKYIKAYKKYIEIINHASSSVISIERMSKSTGETEDIILKNLNRMVKEKLLINVHIHDDNKTIVLKSK